jgi:hypothetical protein
MGVRVSLPLSAPANLSHHQCKAREGGMGGWYGSNMMMRGGKKRQSYKKTGFFHSERLIFYYLILNGRAGI